jgi:IS30 family transposase
MAKHLSERERYIIEHELSRNTPVAEIARGLGRSRACVYNEIRRGTVGQLDSDLVMHQVYKADAGQRVREEHCRLRGVGRLKIGNDIVLAQRMGRLLSDGFSPYAAMESLTRAGVDVCFSLSTCYNYIRMGLFLGYEKPRRKKRQHAPRRWKNGCILPTIEDRPTEVNTRATFGHWEMDTVVSGHNRGGCLLVLTERKTRIELIRRMDAKSIECVQRELDSLQCACGSRFGDIFRSITTDNGSEFKGNGVLAYGSDGNKRVDMYLCHPYCSGERGSNENQNRFIRRFIPKGAAISSYSQGFIARMQDFINSYPRRMFNGSSSAEMFRQELAKLGLDYTIPDCIDFRTSVCQQNT